MKRRAAAAARERFRHAEHASMSFLRCSQVFTDKSGGDSPEATKKKTSQAGQLLKVRALDVVVKLPCPPSLGALLGEHPLHPVRCTRMLA